MKYVVIVAGFFVLLPLAAQEAPAESSKATSSVSVSKVLGTSSQGSEPPSSTIVLRKRRLRRLPYRDGMPRPPAGMQECTEALLPVENFQLPIGETIRYTVEIDSLSVGTIDFKVVNRGIFSGTQVDEYRSLFKIDGLVSTFMPVRGQAASVVKLSDLQPLRAMNRYSIDETRLDEKIEFTTNATELVSTRERNGKSAKQSRSFDYSVQDFVTAFYQLRRMPRDIEGCVVIYSNLRAYTVWIRKEGEERIKTPIGYKLADRYSIKYGSEYSKLAKEGSFWVGVEDIRLPYRLVIDSRHTLEANVYLYEPGTQD